MAETIAPFDKSAASDPSSPPSPRAAPHTPAMRQYVEQKARVGDAILLFRMGDFYETFYEDAELCARVLGIALTARSKGSHPIPLAGIPFHALDGYLKKLVDAGYKVAISEQLEDPKLAKGVVKRDVVRIVTAGTLTDASLLDDGDDNLLASIVIDSDHAGLALVELVSGLFEVVDLAPGSLLDELVRAKPAEVLIEDRRSGPGESTAGALEQLCATTVTRRPAHEYTAYQAEQTLLAHFKVATLAGFGFDAMTPALCAAGALIGYLNETQKTSLAHLGSLTRRGGDDFLLIDHSTWRSLEIEQTLRAGSREGTLLWAIDRTVHPIGRRRLRTWLRRPLIDRPRIIARQDAVSYFLENAPARDGMRTHLRGMADMERIAGRVALRRSGPRDLRALGDAITALPDMVGLLRASRIGILDELAARLEGLDALGELLQRAVAPEAPAHTRDGGYIADGFDARLDELRGLKSNALTWLSAYQIREIERTGIANLKVGYNRVFGYYLEVPHASRSKVPPDFVRRQTLKNAERYITEELKRHETEVLSAEDKAKNLEATLLEGVLDKAVERVPDLLAAADALGRVDCLAGFAQLAAERRYTRPTFVDEISLLIEEGRHPVLDQTLQDAFVPNDTIMAPDRERLFVITGPNMAGKSTYIRQVALLAIMAQVGCFVPARRMSLSVVDRAYARIGASDEITRGQSTFMVEMIEAARILHGATDHSLVVLDEIGRGTSTFDGLSLAWAIAEHLASKIQCRCLVATHYHEMTELAELFREVRNLNVAVREVAHEESQEERIVFLHRIAEGAADKSYGIHVARLAGLPQPVIARSREVLRELEHSFARDAKSRSLAKNKSRNDAQLSLFAPADDALLQALRAVDPDAIAPIAALRLLADWKDRFAS